jgi:hypothetical protein
MNSNKNAQIMLKTLKQHYKHLVTHMNNTKNAQITLGAQE